mgnify:CR=1 FL=1
MRKIFQVSAFITLICAMVVDFVSNYVVNPLTFLGTILVGIVLIRMKIDDGGKNGRKPANATAAEKL